MIFEPCTGHDLLDVDLPVMDFPRAEIEALAHQIVEPRLSCVMRSDGGDALACFGLKPMWSGVAEAWAFLSEKSLRHPIPLSRAAKQLLELGQLVYEFKRIQCIVKEEHAAGHTWAQWLGFEPEGRMLNYGYGGHGVYWMYARIKEQC